MMRYLLTPMALMLLLTFFACDDEEKTDNNNESGTICCAYSMTTSGLGSSGTPTTKCSCSYAGCSSGFDSTTDCYEGSCITTSYSNVREVEECESVLAADDCEPGVIECLGGEYYKECLSFGEWSDKKTCFNKCDLFSSRYDCVDGACVCN